MNDRFQKQWKTLGAVDPYWAVLSDSDRINGQWDKTDFFQTGADEISGVIKNLSDQGIGLRFELALDYGCGVGRLSRALSTQFTQVIGVDFSETMLLEAKAVNKDFKNIQFIQNNGKDIVDVADESIDFLYSSIVLQHAEREVQLLLLKEFFRVLRPGATIVFQTPSKPNSRSIAGLAHLFFGNRVLNIVKRIYFGKGHVMEMHTLNKPEVLRLLEKNGMSLCEAKKSNAAGNAFVSYTYYAQKK